MTETEALILAKLNALSDEVHALRLAVERGGRHIKNAEPDAAAMAGLLHAIVATERRDYNFTSAELSAHAQLTEPECVALCAAIVGAVGSLNPRRIGKFLHHIEGHSFGGLSVHRLGADRNGAIWKIVAA